MNILFVGGSNTLLNHGYVSTFLEEATSIYGYDLGRVENLAIGGNSSVHGLELLLGVRNLDEFDVIFVEYMINDIHNKFPFDTWAAGYEGMLRAALNARPNIRVISVLFSQRTTPDMAVEERLFSHAKTLAEYYKIECIDIRDFIANFSLQSGLSLSDIYVDNAHYRRPNITKVVGQYIANCVFGKQGSQPKREMPTPLSQTTFDKSSLFDFSVQSPESEFKRFENSRGSWLALKLEAGTDYKYLIPGRLLALTFIAAPDSGALTICEEGEEPFYIEAGHREVFSEKYAFLIRSFVLSWKDWSSSRQADLHQLSFRIADAPPAPEIPYRRGSGMTRSPNFAHRNAYLCSVLCFQP